MKKYVYIVTLFLGLLLFISCPIRRQDPPPEPPPAAQPRDGIYVGIVTFGPRAEDITGGSPIYLDEDGLNTLNELLDSKYTVENTIGTALFYAAHLALANMTRAQPILPQNLGVVAMFTFTDGLDVSSTGLSLPPIDDPGNIRGLRFAGEDLMMYQYFIKLELYTRRINNTPINAFVAAVRGDDVTDDETFQETLLSLVSNRNNIERNDMEHVSDMFRDIAATIVEDLTTRSFIMITPEYPHGTRVRMTFNGEANYEQAQNALRYIEGEIAIQNNRYYLTNITYGGGVRASTGDRIVGTIERGSLVFEFPNFSGYDLSQSQAVLQRDLRQWVMRPIERRWQINSEYRPGNEINAREVRNNALVYIVLDRSSSIRQEDVERVREYAKRFIRQLYDAHQTSGAD